MPKRKGAQPSPKKPADQRLGHHPERTALVLLPPAERVKAPPLPRDYDSGVRRIWREFWQSAVASAVDRRADLPALVHWAWCHNELATTLPVLEKSRLITGSNGQPILNPLARYVRDLRRTIEHVEIEFGMTPLSRSRLGLTIGQAKLTAQELNRRLERQAVEHCEEPAWASEWEEA